jgi:putative tryptophan/tyrosine transport system substrate-binding protein
MSRYRRMIAIGWVLMVVCSFGVLGKQDIKAMKTIGILQMTPALDSSVEAFKQRLEWLGYREGESVQYVYRNAHGSKAAIGDAAKNLATLPVDLFFTLTTVATEAAKAATAHRAIPIVFTAVLYPQEAGLIERIEHPGGWITGSSPLVLASKQLEVFARFVPSLRTLGVVYTNDDHLAAISELFQAAQARQLVVKSVTVKRHEEVMQVVTALVPLVDALYIPPDNIVTTQMETIVHTALDAKIPLMAPTELGVKQGALLSYAADYQELAVFAADMAHKVFQGEKPAEMPVEYPVKPKLTVNLKTSRAIGLHISPTLIYLADAVIE